MKKIREQQLKELNAYLEEVKQKGYYVIIGGDFNQDLLSNNPMYNYDLEENNPFISYISHKKPNWLQMFFNEDKSCDITDGFTVVPSSNAPTCRDISVEWEIGEGYVSVIDGFIVSDNIEVISSKTYVTKNGNKQLEHFAYSDHDPVLLTFKLK
jgi:exonuclease III